MEKTSRLIRQFVDLMITLLIWSYFIFGFLAFFSPFYIVAFLFTKNREISFQKLNHFYYRSFFGFVKIIIPHVKFDFQKNLFSIHSSVVVCNHISYLDPILLVSIFKKQKTIVKSTFFHIPVFGWLLKTSGYIPSIAGNNFELLMIRQIENMKEYLKNGGNLFIFPEGTRSQDGTLGNFNKSAITIAKKCNAPIKVLFIKNTNALFPAGRFLFNTRNKTTIRIKQIADIKPSYDTDSFSSKRLAYKIRTLIDSYSKTDQD